MRAAALLAAILMAACGEASAAAPPTVIRVEPVSSPGLFIDGEPRREPEVVPKFRALVSARPDLAD